MFAFRFLLWYNTVISNTLVPDVGIRATACGRETGDAAFMLTIYLNTLETSRCFTVVTWREHFSGCSEARHHVLTFPERRPQKPSQLPGGKLPQTQ
jgi:hypothetical protein